MLVLVIFLREKDAQIFSPRESDRSSLMARCSGKMGNSARRIPESDLKIRAAHCILIRYWPDTIRGDCLASFDEHSAIYRTSWEAIRSIQPKFTVLNHMYLPKLDRWITCLARKSSEEQAEEIRNQLCLRPGVVDCGLEPQRRERLIRSILSR